MRTVRFLEGPTMWPYARQSPKGDGVFGDTRFLFGPGNEPTDWLVVLNEIPPEQMLAYPRERTIFFTGEPPSVRTFHPDYLAQFGTIVTTDRTVGHPNVIFRAPPVPWHVGINSRNPAAYRQALTFGQLLETPPKTRLCSCICSKKAYTPGHRARLAFVKRLKQELGSQIDFFGRGFRDMQDKDEALAPYRYHIAIENCAVEDYWTEKLADAYLRNCFPIYAGAPNIGGYFDPSAMMVIDIGDPDRSISAIGELLASDTDRQSAAAIAEAKRRVLWDHNILAVVDDLAARAENSGATLSDARPLLPEAAFLPPVVPKLRKRVLRSIQTAIGWPAPRKSAP